MRHCAAHCPWYRQPQWAILGSLGSSRGVLSILPRVCSACSRAGMGGPMPWKQPTCGGRGGARLELGGTIFLCYIQQSRPTRGRPGYIEGYTNPSITNGKPSRRPAVTAHMPHVPPEHPNSHSRSATASERLGFTLVTDGLRMLHVPPTGSRYYRGYPPGQKNSSPPPEAYRASGHIVKPLARHDHRFRSRQLCSLDNFGLTRFRSVLRTAHPENLALTFFTFDESSPSTCSPSVSKR